MFFPTLQIDDEVIYILSSHLLKTIDSQIHESLQNDSFCIAYIHAVEYTFGSAWNIRK